MLCKCCTRYASKFGKLSSGHRTGRVHLSFQSQRRAMPKNVQTTVLLHSPHTLVMLKILQGRVQQYVNRERPDFQAGFRKGRGTRDQIAISGGSSFILSSFTFIKRLLNSSLLSAIRVVSSAYLRLFIFLLAILILA